MGSGRKKIEMKKIDNILHRRVAFTKRRNGLFKKAKEISKLTGCRVAVLAFSSSVMKPYLYGDISLLEAAAVGNSNGIVKLETLLSGTSNLEIGSCGTSHAIVGGDLKMCLGRDDDGDLCSTEDYFVGSDEDTVAEGVANAGCSVITSTSDMMTMQYNSDNNNDSGSYLGHGDDKDLCFTDDARFDVGGANASLSNHTSVGCVFGGHGEDGDEKDLAFTDEEFAQLMKCDFDEEPVAVCAENASCDVDTSSSDLTMMMHQHYKTNYGEGDALKMGTFEVEHYNYDDHLSAAMSTTTRPKGNDDGLLMKQRMEAFKEAMKDQYRMACEAGDMISEEDPFIIPP